MFSKKPTCHPRRRQPKKEECDRFLRLYKGFASQSNIDVPQVVIAQVNKRKDKLDLRKAGLNDNDMIVLCSTLMEVSKRCLVVSERIKLKSHDTSHDMISVSHTSQYPVALLLPRFRFTPHSPPPLRPPLRS